MRSVVEFEKMKEDNGSNTDKQRMQVQELDSREEWPFCLTLALWNSLLFSPHLSFSLLAVTLVILLCAFQLEMAENK